MNHHYSNGPLPIFNPAYPPNPHPSARSSRPQAHGLPHHHLSADTLPPLTAGIPPASTFGNDAYPIRTQPLGPSLMTTSHEQVSQPGSYPVYAPTANTFYHGQSPNFSRQNQSQHLNHRPTSNLVSDLLAHPAYTSAPTQARLTHIRPMPPRGNGRSSSSSTATPTNHSDGVEEPPPTHVVGSQGRRGILPSAAGRPVAIVGANTSGHKAAPTPEKDEQGKYPCEHCTKTYLHAKHLKRHLLRREYTLSDCFELILTDVRHGCATLYMWSL